VRYYPRYTTTVIGSHSVPRWYEALERLVESERLSKADLADAQYRATQAAIVEQEAAGIDLISGGEMQRRTNNRHAPGNAMLNYFWTKIPAFRGETRPRAVTPADPKVVHPAAVCRAKIAPETDLGLVEEFALASRYATRPVKMTLTGPLTLGKFAHDAFYGELAPMLGDLGLLLRFNLRKLVDAGCKDLQIDEMLFSVADDGESAQAVEVLNLALEGLPPGVHVAVHVCLGNYAVGYDYDGQLGHRYFDTGRYPVDEICKIECSSFLVEEDAARHYRGKLGNRQLGVGVVDVGDVAIEAGELVAERAAAIDWLAPEQTILTASCGLNHLPRHIAFGKLQALAEAKRLLAGRPGTVREHA
jgi:5-methyltetrahydropteroyltriglutamate--homocysteine methyltransferase